VTEALQFVAVLVVSSLYALWALFFAPLDPDDMRAELDCMMPMNEGREAPSYRRCHYCRTVGIEKITIDKHGCCTQCGAPA